MKTNSILLGLALAALPSGAAWQYRLPDTGLLPYAARVSGTNAMGERHGGSTLQWERVNVQVPLADPFRSGGEGWMFNASLGLDWTHLKATGQVRPEHEDLFTLTLPLGVVCPLAQGRHVAFCFFPTVATDGAGSGHSFVPVSAVDYRLYRSETFTCSVGLSYDSHTIDSYVTPYVTFVWKPTPDWRISLTDCALRGMRELGGGWAAGLFAGGVFGTWAMHEQEGTTLLRLRSLVAGARVERVFSRNEHTTSFFFADVGSTLTTSLQRVRPHALDEPLSNHHYHPGLYLSLGVDCRF